MTNRPLSSNEFLSRGEAAQYLGIKKRTLEIWAMTGRHEIPYIKIGRSTRYRKSDLDNLILRRTFPSSKEVRYDSDK